MNIYHTDLDTTDFDLENQLMLEAKVKYALVTDHTHLIDANDYLFEITVDGDEITLTEVDIESKDEEYTDEEYVEEPFYEQETDEQLSTTEIIDLVIRNSLLSTEPIREEQAHTMLILANLKRALVAE